jgi:hypothetical protein
MKLLARLRLCYQVLAASRTGEWRKLAASCSAEQARLGNISLLAALATARALDAERAQVAAGTRTTHTAAKLLEEAQRLVQPKAKP